MNESWPQRREVARPAPPAGVVAATRRGEP
jgi:hypothetical protein